MSARPLRYRLAALRTLGVAGSLVTVVGGLLAGVRPVGEVAVDLPIVHQVRASTALSVAVVYVGLTLLLLAWWRVGRQVRSGDISCRSLATTAAWWAGPFALTIPIFSGDVHSYLAQGAMTRAGLDAYQVGPAALGGPLTVNVPAIWQHTPAPYGPVFLNLAGGVTEMTGGGVWVGILGMRLLALLGVALLVWSVPRLARFCGVRPAAAMWLGVLNPLVLLHLIGDAHNEAVMLGLMCVGLVMALRRRPAVGVVLLTLATLVKAPAALAIAFVVPIWAQQLAGSRPRLRAAARTGAVAGVTALSVTALAGMSFGWVQALGTPTHARTWMSITTDLGWAVGTVLHHLTGVGVEQTRHAVWLVGLVVAAGLCLSLWRRSERIGPVTALGLSLAVLVIAGPVVHPWYLLWAIVPLAAAAGTAIRRVVTGGSVALVLLVLPGGVQPGLAALVGALAGTVPVLVVTAAFRRLRRGRGSASPVAEPVGSPARPALRAGRVLGRPRGGRRLVAPSALLAFSGGADQPAPARPFGPAGVDAPSAAGQRLALGGVVSTRRGSRPPWRAAAPLAAAGPGVCHCWWSSGPHRRHR
ncbi:polyprenol phosphomannose-dependent alpha 1,6 mannosyltransferase MptB [Micromonospora sp. DR5-3]|uniref:polyprenol phosphomannose-dependent alpha 1,6 mannosyltransferase MptB n=1 Tax=unclassified Micromonospora TaxID=2617518 RepID=UPI0016520CBD|nr:MULTISPECIES: polyprenol phosphomannose-dependent alpha 1,6 mannosyltransferase MptB [unclassified Micromonospora]MCW3816145.1 polyprenol phosphomannose-dependent alpha 1,6 mannosyltransferase MptB [Micromonospora sp. DR5-3]